MLKVVAPETSARMKRVRRSDTAPELAVRRVLTAIGVSYRTGARDLPGTPDIVNRSAGWAIFVHGCFWHGHAGCALHTVPKTNQQFWLDKVAANRRRDGRKARAVRARGLRVVTVWQCETRNPEQLARRLRRVLDCQPSQMGGNDRAFLRAARPTLLRPKADLRIVDLFSGCGGLTLGVGEAARLLGKRLAVQLAVESDPAIAGAYAANFCPANGGVASDIADWFDSDVGEKLSLLERRTRKRVGQVDLLVGGPPCQGHSTLNYHRRGDDPKNALYLKVVRAAEVLRPRAVIVENVPALKRDPARTLDIAIEQLHALGYKVDHGVVSVVDLGVPQLRQRHVLIAHAHVQPDLKAAMSHARVRERTLRWAIGDLAGCCGNTPLDTPSALTQVNRKRAEYLLRKGLYDLPNSRRPRCQRDAHKYKSMYGRLSWDRPAQTITTGFGSPGQGRYLHPSEVRTLTPHEAARVQFFPDWYDFSKIRHQRYLARAIGNAVPPKLAFVMAFHLLSLGQVARNKIGAPRDSQSGRTAAVAVAAIR